MGFARGTGLLLAQIQPQTGEPNDVSLGSESTKGISRKKDQPTFAPRFQVFCTGAEMMLGSFAFWVIRHYPKPFP